MSSHRVVKWFRDYADDIEAVNIHYVLTPIDGTPDWNQARTTRYMPLIGKSIRMKELRLPLSITDNRGRPSNCYTLHYYFEICQSGDRQYSPLYSEEVVTGIKDGSNVDISRSENEVGRG
jgi:hypothetical protein